VNASLKEHETAIYKEGVYITSLGALSNVALTALKGAAGLASNSPAMLADAVHSLSDLVSDGVTMWAFMIARKPADEDHPYGHGKFETIGAFLVSGLLGGAGAGIGYHSYHCLISQMEVVHPPLMDPATQLALAASDPLLLALGAAGASLVVKEILFHKTMAVAARANSSTLEANAWHHRSDSLSSVVAFVGIGGSMMGYPLLDPIAGLVVGCMIVKSAGEMAIESMKELTDEVDTEVLKELSKVVSAQNGVKSHYNIRARKMGHYTLVDLQIQVNDKYSSVSAATQVVERVRDAIMKSNTQVSEVMVRLHAEDPSKLTLMREPSLIELEIRERLNRAVFEINDITHIQFHFLDSKLYVQIEITVDDSLRVREVNDIAKRIREITEKVRDVHRCEVYLDLDEGSPSFFRSKVKL
jgi:cation diffusion facilitator family transporter